MSATPAVPRLEELGRDLLATSLLRRWLACGLVSGIGIGAAVVALVLPDVPWKYLERKGDALKGAAEEVSA